MSKHHELWPFMIIQHAMLTADIRGATILTSEEQALNLTGGLSPLQRLAEHRNGRHVLTHALHMLNVIKQNITGSSLHRTPDLMF